MAPGARVDFLEAMVRWHLGNTTSTDLVLREVQEAIVAEVTSFPVDKVAVGESPSVAMHVPVPLLRASQAGVPRSTAELGRASVAMRDGGGGGGGGGSGGGGAAVEGFEIGNETLLARFPEWRGWAQPSVALTLRAVLMTASALTAAAGMQQPMIGIEKRVVVGGGGGGSEVGVRGSGDANANDSSQYSHEELARRRRSPQILLPEGVVPEGDLSDLRAFFEALWPNSPYSFGKIAGREGQGKDGAVEGEGTREGRCGRRPPEWRIRGWMGYMLPCTKYTKAPISHTRSNPSHFFCQPPSFCSTHMYFYLKPPKPPFTSC